LFTLTNRCTNDEIVLKIPDRSKKSVVQALDKLERLLGTEKFRDVFAYIIFDNGIEFRGVNGIENSCLNANVKRTKIYFAHPYRSWERAINENGNRIIRKYLPKGKTFDGVSDKDIWKINMLINLTHRKRLKGRSSYELGSIISLSNLNRCTWT
jgi:IS30 family transposase